MAIQWWCGKYGDGWITTNAVIAVHGPRKETTTTMIASEVEKLIAKLAGKFGPSVSFGHSRLLAFGGSFSCSINYSKLLRGEKFFFGLAREVVDSTYTYPPTGNGDFVLLVCGSADKVLVLPRALILDMLRGVVTRKLDLFREGEDYILQTTRHPKLPVTEFLNKFPQPPKTKPLSESADPSASHVKDRTHVAAQGGLIVLGRAEGCSVWVPPNDRNLAIKDLSFAEATLGKLPNFGFDEFTRRIIHNIDVLWLHRNTIRKAFEIETSTSIYSGLLRLNDLTIAQPNVHIDLFIVAQKKRRQQVYNQLLRPSFQGLASSCGYITTENVEEQIERLKSLGLDKDARVQGLLNVEKFNFPDSPYYPTDV